MEGLIEEIRDFVKWVPRNLIQDMDANRVRYPKEFVVEAARRNLLGLRFGREWGGRGFGWVEEAAAIEEIGVLGTSLACLYSLVSIVGEALAHFGTGEQKKRYLVPLLKGELFCAEALTEPRGGSDFFGTTTTAERRGGDFILKGQKRFVVGAEGADIFLVYAKTSADLPPHRSISAFVVERSEGVRVKYLYSLMGTRGGGTGRLIFEEVRVPAANLIGEENGGADVFYRMMIPERMTSAAGAIGIARAALEVAARYADRRKAFGQKIRNFEAVSFKIADGATLLDAGRSLIAAAAAEADRSGPNGRTRRLVSEAKKFCTDSAWEIVNQAMQVLGGIGYTDVYPVERLLRDARLMMIWTGTNEIMNLIIAHEYFKEVLSGNGTARDIEYDAPSGSEDEKVFE